MIDNTVSSADDKYMKKNRVLSILKIFKKIYPHPKCHLIYKNPFQLLIGSILSAQCTDKRVNEITKHLFKKYKNPEQFSIANRKVLEKEIHSAGFFRNKANSIINCSKQLVDDFNGQVPVNMDELTSLAGVGRKTANVVLGNAYRVPGIIVDTHIKRLSNRIGLSKSGDPTRIEFELMEIVPKKQWIYFSNALGDHGREICSSRNPKCDKCKINHLCLSVDEFRDKVSSDGKI